MNVIAKSALVNFWSSLPKGAPRETAEAAMMEWYTTASKASWSNFSELKKTFNSADIVAATRLFSTSVATSTASWGWSHFDQSGFSFCLSGRTPSTMRSTSKTSDVKGSRRVGFESFSNASE